MSHEQSETIQRPDGKWINVYGHALPRAGQQLPGTPTYDTVDDAVSAAKARSASFDSAHDEGPVNTPEVTVRPDPNDPNRGLTDPLPRRTEPVGEGGWQWDYETTRREMQRRADAGELSQQELTEFKALTQAKTPAPTVADPTKALDDGEAVGRPGKPAAGTPGDAVRGLQIAGTSAIKGLATIPGMPSDLVELGANVIGRYLNWQAGDSTLFPDVNIPGGTAEILAALPDSFKPPKDMTPFERVASTAIEVQASALLPIALSTKLLSNMDPQTLARVETAWATTGGLTLGVVREYVGEHPVTDFLALLSGSLGPQVVGKIIRKARDLSTHIFGQISEERLQESIGEQFNAMTSPEAIDAGLAERDALRQDNPESAAFSPTTGQVSKSPALIQSERAYQRSSSERGGKASSTLAANQKIVMDFIEKGAPEGKLDEVVTALEESRGREMAVVDAGLIRAQAYVEAAKHQVTAATERIIAQADRRAGMAEGRAQDRINALRPTLTKDEAVAIVRQEYAQELDEFIAARNAKYDAIDPAGTVHLNVKPLKAAAARVREEYNPRVEKAERLPQDLLSKIDGLGTDWEMGARLEKVAEDLKQIPKATVSHPLMRYLRGKGGVSDQGGELQAFLDKKKYDKTSLPGFRATGDRGMTLDQAAEAAHEQGLIPERSIDSLLFTLREESQGRFRIGPGWYQELTTGKNPLDRGTIEKAIDSLQNGTAHGLHEDTLKHVQSAIKRDREFAHSSFYHEGMDVVGGESESFSTLKRLEAEVNAQIREARAQRNDPLLRRLTQLRDGVFRTIDQLEVVPEMKAIYPDVHAAYLEANAFTKAGTQRLKAGEIAAVNAVDRAGRFKVWDEDLAAQFLEGETPVNDFVQALGTRTAALGALREFAKHDFIKSTVYPAFHEKAGQVNVNAAGKWLDTHKAALALFPEVRAEMEGAAQWQRMATEYREAVRKLEKAPEKALREKNPTVFGELTEAERKLSDQLDLRDRTVKGWEKSLASDFLGKDADRVAQVIVRSGKPRTILADLDKRIGNNPEAQNGLNRALWDAALDKNTSQRTDLLGNRALLSNQMRKFLRDNEEWMTERFGAARVQRMKDGASAMAMLDGTGRPVLPGGSDTMANISSVMMDWGPFFSRLYAEQSGRVGASWLVSERVARLVGKVLKSKSEEFASELLEEAFYNPEKAKAWMLAARMKDEKAAETRLRNILFPKGYLIEHVAAQEDTK